MTTKSFIVIKDKAQVLTNKTIDADSNVIQNLEADNIKTVTSSDEDKVFVVKSNGSWEMNYNKEYHEVSALPATGNSRFLYYLNTADATHKVGLYIYSNSAYVNVGSSSVEVVDALPATGKTDTLYVLKDDSTISILGRYSVADSYTSTYEIKDGGIWDSASSAYITYQTVEDAFRTAGMPEYLVSNPTDGEMVRYRYKGNTYCGYYNSSTSSKGMTTYVYSDNQWVKSLGLQEVDGITVSLTSAGKVEVKDNGVTFAKVNSSAVSTSIPTSGAVDTKLTTEKAVGDYSVAKQYTSAEDNYVARVDPTDHVLKPMIKLSDVQVVSSLPATGTENTLYALKTDSAVLHKYAINLEFSFDYEIVEGGIKDMNTGEILYTYATVEEHFAEGTPEYLEEDDTAGTLIRLTYDGKTMCQYSGTALPYGTKPYVYYDGAYVYLGRDTNAYLPLTGGTLTGKLICNNETTVDIQGVADVDLEIAAGCDDCSVYIYGGTSETRGAFLQLDGHENLNTRGGFTLTARDYSAHRKELKGSPDGDLTWDNNVGVSSDSVTGNLVSANPVLTSKASLLNGTWLLSVMGKSTIITRHTNDAYVTIGGIVMTTGDYFYLGDYKLLISSIYGSITSGYFGLNITVADRTVGEYLQATLTGL